MTAPPVNEDKWNFCQESHDDLDLRWFGCLLGCSVCSLRVYILYRKKYLSSKLVKYIIYILTKSSWGIAIKDEVFSRQSEPVCVSRFFSTQTTSYVSILVQKTRQGSLCSKLFSVDDLPTPRRERERSHDKRWHSWWGIWKSGDPVVRDRRWQHDIRSKHDHLVGDLQGENEMTKFQQSNLNT